MIYLDMVEGEDRGIYFDIQAVEQRGSNQETVYALTGTLGDGACEEQVLVELGRQVEVTFVDAWLGRRSGVALTAEKDDLETALAASLERLLFCVENFPSLEGKPRARVVGYRSEGRWLPLRPAGYGEQLELPMGVAEDAGPWRCAVA